MGFFFAGFFSAHGYYQFIGFARWTAAACLLVPRTATLGALLYLPIVVNIFAITVAIGAAFAFTRVITGAMLVANLYLLFWDWDRWRLVLPRSGPVSHRHGDLRTMTALLVAGVLGLQGVTGLHMARLRGDLDPTSVAVLGAGVALAAGALVVARRRAVRATAGVRHEHPLV